jgi:hypothetical protein
MNEGTKDFVASCMTALNRWSRTALWHLLAVFSVFSLAPAAGWTQGLPVKTCTSSGATIQAYLCVDDIVVVDGSGYNSAGIRVGGLYLIDPVSGNQTLIASGGYLGQAASVAVEPGTGKLIAVSRTYGVIRVDPKDGSQEVLMKGGTGWGSTFPTFSDPAHNNATEMFIYPGGVTIDPVDSSILVTDTGINLYNRQLNSDPPGAPNCTGDVRTCEALGGKVIRIRKAQGQGPGIYSAPEVVAKGGTIQHGVDFAAAAGSTTLTSATFNFQSWMVGYNITITSGTNFVAGTYKITGFTNATTVSLDSSPTPSGAGSGGVGDLIRLISEPFDIAAVSGGSLYLTDMNAKLGGALDTGSGGIIFLNATSNYNQSTFFSSYSVNANSLGCPMGITIDGSGNVIASVFSYNGYGCAPAGVFILSPNFGGGSPNFSGLISGSPFQYPFGMDMDRGDGQGGPPRIIIADEGSGYNCSGTIFRLDLSKPIVRTSDPGWTLSTLNPLALSPMATLGCSPPNQTYLATPSDATVVKAAVSANIANTAPSNVSVSMSPAAIDENGSASLSGTFADPDSGDTHTVTIAWGDGSPNTVLNLAAGVLTIPATSHQYLDNPASNPYSVTVTVADAKASATGNTSVTVRDVAPAITGVSGPLGAIAPGSAATVGVNFTDPGTLDTHTCTFSWGDSQTDTVTASGTGNGTCTANHTYNASGTFTVGVTVTDKDGGSVTNSTLKITVNTPPAGLSLSTTPATISENGSMTLSGSFTDPDTADTHTVVVDWGDGSAKTSLSLAAGVVTFSSSHVYLDNPAGQPSGAFTISVTVTDSLQASASANATVTVNNALPAITTVTGPSATIGVGVAANITANFTDAGTLDTHTCSVNWGDGNTSTGSVTETNGSGSCTASHNYAAPGTYSVTVTVTDKDGGSATNSTLQIRVNTPPAQLQLGTTPASISENDSSTLNGSFTDPDTDQTHTVVVDWGDGSAKTTLSLAAGVVTFNANHKYLDNPAGQASGAFTISVTVTDSLQAAVSANTTVTVNNALPAITTVTGPSATIGVGVAANITANFTDAGTLDTHTCSVNWGDGNTSTGSVTETNGSGSCTASHNYAASGTYSVAITVTDKDGGSATNSTLQVRVNTPPAQLQLGTTPATINENDSTTLNGSFTDPDTDQTHTVVVDWGDGSAKTTLSLAAGVVTFNANHKYLDNPAGQPSGAFTISVTVTDSLQTAVSANTTVTVKNVGPSITTVTGPSATIGVGVAANITANFTDAGTLDTHTCSVNWGDGNTSTGSVTETNGSGSCTASHSYAAPGTYSVTITVTDKDGGSATNSTLQVRVNTPPAQLQLGATPASINENDSTTLNGSFTDPDTDQTHIVVVDWRDGSAKTTLSLAAGVVTFTANHQYLDNPAGQPSGAFTISVTVTDSLQAAVTGTTAVSVNNAVPVVTQISGPASGLSVNLTASFTDPGTLDTHTCSVNWGDGNTSTGTVAETNGSGNCTTSHTYAAAGTYSINVTVSDKDGGSGAKSLQVTVANAQPVISSLAPTPNSIYEGDTTTLNGAFTDPNAGNTHTVVINWGDGSSTTSLSLAAGVFSFAASHQYRNNPPGSATATFTISVSVTNNVGGSGSGSTSITVSDAAPAITGISGYSHPIVGTSLTVTATFTDAGVQDTHTCTFGWGDGTSSPGSVTESGGSGSCSAPHTYAKAGTYTASVTVGDEDGVYATQQFKVGVNSKPTVSSATLSSSTLIEGNTTILQAAISDSDTTASHAVTIDWSDGATDTINLSVGILNFSANHKYKNNGPKPPVAPSYNYPIQITVTNNWGASGSGSVTQTVNNTNPVVSSITGPTSLSLGAGGTFTANFTDPGVLDTHTCTFTWGDTHSLSGAVTESGGTGSCTATYLYQTAGTYSVGVTVTDDDGGSVSSSYTVVVYPDPTISSATLSPSTVYEGSPTTLQGSISDPDTSATHTVTLTWGDGGSDTITLGPGVLSFPVNLNHTYWNNGPKPASPLAPAPSYTYKIQIGVTNNHGGTGSGSASVTVNNANPVITSISGPTSLNLATNPTGTFTVNFTDAGILDIHFCSFTWGDGHVSQPGPTESNGKGSCTATYTYTTAGTYSVSISVSDDDGGRITSTYQVVVSRR